MLRAWTHRNCIEMQLMAHFPHNHVISAGSVAAQSETDDLSISRIKGETTAEYNNAADRLANHRVVGSAKCCRTAECGLWIWRLAGSERVQALAELSRGVDIRRGDRVIAAAETLAVLAFEPAIIGYLATGRCASCH